MCHAQGHNAVTPVRLEPAALRSGIKHSPTERATALPLVHLSVHKLNQWVHR